MGLFSNLFGQSNDLTPVQLTPHKKSAMAKPSDPTLPSKDTSSSFMGGYKPYEPKPAQVDNERSGVTVIKDGQIGYRSTGTPQREPENPWRGSSGYFNVSGSMGYSMCCLTGMYTPRQYESPYRGDVSGVAQYTVSG